MLQKKDVFLMKKSFQLSAIAIAISLTSAVYADTNISDIDNVNVIVDSNDGSIGAFNVIKGVTNPTTLITSDVNSSGGTIINTNTTINGNLAVNGGTSTILTAAPVTTGADLVIPTVNPAFSNTTQPFSQNRVDTQDQTRSVDAHTSPARRAAEFGCQQSWTTSQTASAQYDANGVIIPGSLTGPVLGATVDNGFVASSVNKVQDLTLGRNNTSEDYRLSITKTDNGVTNTTTVSAAGISTNQITLNGQDLATTIANGDTTTLAAANSYTDSKINAEAATRAAADTALNTRVDNETAARTAADTQLQANIDTEAATRAAADTALNTRVDNETAARTAADTQIRTDFAAADAATLTSAKGYTDTTATTLRSEAAAETVRVNKAIIDGDAATLSSAKGYTDTKSAATLASANAYTDGRANQLNTRIDDVQRTAYRGIAISLAAQQAVPSIGPGQVAIFGGVGHYEGETAGSIGVVTAFTDRLSASGAFGFAGGNEFGGRVGVAYVFGGK